MIPTVTKLIIKVEQLEWELAQVKEELVKLQASEMKSLTPEERASAYSAEELQKLLLEEGVNPEDNLGSRAIIEEREKLRG